MPLPAAKRRPRRDVATAFQSQEIFPPEFSNDWNQMIPAAFLGSALANKSAHRYTHPTFNFGIHYEEQRHDI
jgi:hypothetical protein